MAEPFKETWHCVELNDHEITKLCEDVVPKILNENRIDLLPFYGYLSLKDKLWIGKVKFFTPSNELLRALPLAEANIESIGIYVIEVGHRVTDELKSLGPVPHLETSAAIFSLALPSSSLDVQSIYQQFGKYFTTVYGRIPKEKSLERRLILGLPRKMEIACFDENGGKDSEQGDFGTLWTVKANAFIVVLQDPDSLPSEITEHPGYEVREMSLPETLYAVERWKFATESSKYRLPCSRVLGLAIGAFPLGGSTPVSWAFACWDGAISALQTLPGHTGKGLAKAVVSKISVKLMGIGIRPFAYVEMIESSYIPESLFSSLGFQAHKDVCFSWKYPC